MGESSEKKQKCQMRKQGGGGFLKSLGRETKFLKNERETKGEKMG